MWRNYDPAVVREELEVLRRHRVTVTRSFFYWPDFHPEPGTIDEDKATPSRRVTLTPYDVQVFSPRPA